MKIFLWVSFLLATPCFALRVITLAPNLTEMVYAVGAGSELVGVSEYSDFPLETKKLPVVSHFEKPNLEQMLSLKPDLVLGWKEGGEDGSVDQLKKFGISVQWISTQTLLDIPKALVQVGKLTHHSDQGEKASKEFLAKYQKISALKKRVKPVSVFLEIFDSPLYTLGQKSFLNQVLSLCGGQSIFPALPSEASAVSLESVIAANPEVIIVLKPAKALTWQSWPMIKAVQNHQVYEINPDILVRPGPRVLEGVVEVCGQIQRG